MKKYNVYLEDMNTIINTKWGDFYIPFSSTNVKEVVQYLKDHPECKTIEEYTADEDGEFIVGSDFDDRESFLSRYTIHFAEAEQLVTENEDTAAEFTTWLKENRDKEAHEWDSDDLGEFFRSKGYITEVQS